MNVHKCVVRRWRFSAVAAATVMVAMTGLGGIAAASVSPNPYSSITDDVTLTSRSALGNSSCAVGFFGTVRLTGTTGGASGTLHGIESSLCTGALKRVQWYLVSIGTPIGIDVSYGTVTLSNVQFLVENILGGTCLYAGTLTGTMFRGSGTLTVSNPAVALASRLAGLCSTGADVQLTVVTGARITW